MSDKYWVPAIVRAHAVLDAIAQSPDPLKLIELSRRCDIHKSTMFSLLHTMESLQWVARRRDDTYQLGSALAAWGHASSRQFDLVERFRHEAEHTKQQLGESIQLARLDGSDVLYLAKAEAPTPVKLASEPGMRYPAHATALGKAMLAQLTRDHVDLLFPSLQLGSLTPYTIRTKDRLHEELARIRELSYALDHQESIVGFCCAAVPVRDPTGAVIGAVSTSMPLHQWELKQNQAIDEIRSLGQRLSNESQGGRSM